MKMTSTKASNKISSIKTTSIKFLSKWWWVGSEMTWMQMVLHSNKLSWMMSKIMSYSNNIKKALMMAKKKTSLILITLMNSPRKVWKEFKSKAKRRNSWWTCRETSMISLAISLEQLMAMGASVRLMDKKNSSNLIHRLWMMAWAWWAWTMEVTWSNMSMAMNIENTLSNLTVNNIEYL